MLLGILGNLAGLFSIVSFFCFLNGWTVRIGKRAFGYCIPVTMMLAVLVLYFSQFIFHTFDVGLYLLIGSSVLSLLVFLYEIVFKKNNKFCFDFFTGGFWAFLTVCFIFFLIDYNRHFSTWDEFSHWGKMVKEMLRTDAFYSETASNLLAHKDYPPFVSVLELLWCRIAGSYSEMNVTMAVHVFEISVIVPMLVERIEDKGRSILNKLLTSAVIVFAICMLLLTLDVYGTFSTIYTDLFMPLLYVYLVFVILEGDLIASKFGFFALLIGQISLV